MPAWLRVRGGRWVLRGVKDGVMFTLADSGLDVTFTVICCHWHDDSMIRRRTRVQEED